MLTRVGGLERQLKAGGSPVIRRIVLWQWNGAATPERRLRAKEGLAYIRYGGHVDALDFGEDLGGGLGPGRQYDLALERDHADRASWDTYVDDPHHHRVGNYIDEITHMEMTARVDYLYAGPPSTRGAIRHIAMYGWRARLDESDAAGLREELEGFRTTCPELRSIEFGDDLGLEPGHVDWVVEAQFDGLDAMRQFFDRPGQRRLARTLETLADPGRTGWLHYRTLSG